MVHYILINQGYELETHKNGESFYLELVTAQETPSCNHIRRVNDFFIQNKHDNFRVITEHNNGKMKSSPKITNLKEEVFNWLNSLDPDIELLKDKHLLSSMTWHHDDFKIIIKALPLSQSQRAQSHCLYDGSSSCERIITTEQNLIKSLKKKLLDMVNLVHLLLLQ